jgi:hypothetical protein
VIWQVGKILDLATISFDHGRLGRRAALAPVSPFGIYVRTERLYQLLGGVLVEDHYGIYGSQGSHETGPLFCRHDRPAKAFEAMGGAVAVDADYQITAQLFGLLQEI